MRRFLLLSVGVWMWAGLSIVVASEATEFRIRSGRAIYSETSMSARAKGLGHSYAALSNGAAGVIENPAALGAQTSREVMMELGIDEVDAGSESADIITVNVGGAVNINTCAPEYWPRNETGNHTVGFVLHTNSVDFTESGSLESDMTGIVLAYGRSFRDGRHFGGLSFAYSEGGLENNDVSVDQDLKRWEFKLGAITRPSQQLALGSSLSYGRGSINDEGATSNNGEVRHWEFRVGAAYQLTDDVLFVADVAREALDIELTTDTRLEEHKIWTLSAGLERVMIPETLTLRGGLYLTHDDYYSKGLGYLTQNDDYVGATGGLTYYKENMEFTYTLDLRTTGEAGSFIKLGFDW